jgi:phosphate transport system permease protein
MIEKQSAKSKKIANLLHALIIFATVLTVVILAFILLYILINGIPQITWKFLSTPYSARGDNQGILPMIINTVYMVVLTLLIATPIGLSTAVYLTQYAKQGRLVRAIRFTTEVLSGIPSIIFGLVGSALFSTTLGFGYSILSGSLTMTMMILPTIVRTTEEAILSVPLSYQEGALGLGAGRLRVIFTIILPSAMPGILTAVILAMGRIVGESAALIFTLGMAYGMPGGFFAHIMESGRTLTLHLYSLFSVGKDINQSFATAAVLLIVVFLLNRLASLTTKMLKKE